MRCIGAALIGSALFLLGCGGGQTIHPPGDTFATDTIEIADRPTVLADPAAPIDKLTLRGVRLGDPRTAISIHRKISEDDRGWIITRDSCRYRILDDKVITLGLWDRNLLEQLGVTGEQDVARVFGPPEKSEELKTLSGESVIFTYAGGNKRVIYSRFENRITAVNLGAAYLATRAAE